MTLGVVFSTSGSAVVELGHNYLGLLNNLNTITPRHHRLGCSA